MVTDQRRQETAALRRHPSAIEIIAADHPGWEIRRDRVGGAHGDWVASRGEASLAAGSPAVLLERLEEYELERLQAEHGHVYRVWRTPHWWMGSALVDGVTPTLMEPTAHALEARLRDPGPQYGAPFPRDAT